ncbi:hypothetical protein MRX96_039784 [Rhipicephalus microplus]
MNGFWRRNSGASSYVRSCASAALSSRVENKSITRFQTDFTVSAEMATHWRSPLCSHMACFRDWRARSSDDLVADDGRFFNIPTGAPRRGVTSALASSEPP